MDKNMVWPPPHRHHRRGHSMDSGVHEKDEDLALFKDMGKRDKMPFVCPSAGDQLINASVSTKFGGLSHPHLAPPVERKGIGAELLNSDVDKTDYDWLMTPPGTPLFSSLDADSPALQQGSPINRSLATIKTSRVSTDPRPNSPAPNISRGDPSAGGRPTIPRNGQLSAAGTRPRNQVQPKQASNNRPATPIRSSTQTHRTSPNLQARPSTPTRQNSAPARPLTPLGARPAAPKSQRRVAPTSSGRPSSAILGRSCSSPTGCQPGADGSARRNPSPGRSTAGTGTGARGVSPARSGPSRGVSPLRGVSPASSRGQSPSPSLRAPYPVEASNDIPPNLRTTSDRPSSAQRRADAYGTSPGEGRASAVGVDLVLTQRRTPLPARPAAPSLSSSVLGRNLDRASRAASSDSESSFDTCSQSCVSNHGLATGERNDPREHMFGRGSDDYGRSSSLQKARRSSTSPQCGPSASKKSFESAARAHHRGQVAAFRPLMTNSPISTFYSSRASGLLRRPLTPSSTASSSEHGATVIRDSEVGDEDAVSTWKPSNRQETSGAHSPLHLFDKSLDDAAHETGTLDATSIVDNDDLRSFFRTPEAIEVEFLESKCLSQMASNRRDEESQEICNAELNWLSRNEHVEEREYLWSRDVKIVGINIADGAAGALFQGSKQVLSGLDKIRDKLRHLKSTAENEDAECTSQVQQAKSGTDALYALRAPAALGSVVDRDSVVIMEQGRTSEVCCNRKQRQAGAGETSESWAGCRCKTIPTSLPFYEAREGGSARPSLAGGSSSTTVESTDSKSKLAKEVYGKERDIWYIYRHSSEYDVPVAGFSETKMEIHPPQLLAKKDHMRANARLDHNLSRGTESNPISISAQQESSVEREDISPPVYTGKSEYTEKCSSKRQKGNITIAQVFMDVPRNECLISDLAEGGNAAADATLTGKERNRQYSFGLAIEVERRGLEIGGDQINRRMTSSHLETHVGVGAGSKSVQQTGKFSPEGGGEQKLKYVINEPEKANQKALDQNFDDESTQACSSSSNVYKPPHMTPELPHNPLISALSSSSVPDRRATVVNPMSQSSEAEKKPEVSGQPTCSARGGHEENSLAHTADVQASQLLPVNGSHSSSETIAKEHRHSRTESSPPAKAETSEKGLPVYVRMAHALPTSDIGSCTEAHWNAYHALVTRKVKETWQEGGLESETQFGAQPEADVHSRPDEHERTCCESGDEAAFIDVPVDSCGSVTAGPRVSDAVSEHSADTILLNAPLSPSSEPQGHRLAPHKLIEKNLSGLQVGSLTHNNGEILKQLNYQEAQENTSCEDPHVLEKKINTITKNFDTSSDVWNSLNLPPAGYRADILDMREAQKEESERAQHRSGAGATGELFRSGSAMQCSFSKSISSKSAFRAPTSGSSVDLSRSTDTTSSCPSNASWEDPHLYCSKFWDSRSASDVARVSDVSEPAPLLLTKVFTADSALEENDAAKCGAHEVIKVGDLLSYDGELQQSNPEVNGCTRNIVDQRLRASVETASTTEHFDYIFECLGSKGDPSLAEFPIVSKLMPGATISIGGRNSANHVISMATAKPSSNGNSQSMAKMSGTTEGIEVSHKDKTLPKGLSIRENIKNNSRPANSELPNSKVAMSSSPTPTVSVEATIKLEEIVESAESPKPGTREHMPSFECSHKKSANMELKRSNTTFSSNGSGSSAGMPVDSGQQSSDSGTPGSKTTAHTKLNGKPASLSPHLNKGRSVRAASPGRSLTAANAAKTPAEPGGAHGEVALEPSIHSRFSKITVRSGSDTESFDWGRSSLEETSSRCGSSSGTNTASMAILTSSLPQLGCHEVDAMVNGDDHAEPSASGDDDDEDEERRQQASNISPLRRSPAIESEAGLCFCDGATAPSGASAQTVLHHSVVNSRSKPLGSAHRPLEQADPALDLDQKLSPETSTVLAMMNPVLRLRASGVNNYAPSQNLDELSERLEQLESFGARVMLRNPQQHFLHSPNHDHSKGHHNSRRLPAVEQPHLAASFSTSIRRLDKSGHESTSSAVTTRLYKSTTSSKLNECRCTIL